MIGYAVLLVFLLLTGLFGYAYYVRYFKWRACFDEVGRCFDATTGTVYLEQSGTAWLALATAACAGAFFQAYRFTRAKA